MFNNKPFELKKPNPETVHTVIRFGFTPDMKVWEQCDEYANRLGKRISSDFNFGVRSVEIRLPRILTSSEKAKLTKKIRRECGIKDTSEGHVMVVDQDDTGKTVVPDRNGWKY